MSILKLDMRVSLLSFCICFVGFFVAYGLHHFKVLPFVRSLRGKQVHQVPLEYAGNVEHVLAVCDAGQSNAKVS